MDGKAKQMVYARLLFPFSQQGLIMLHILGIIGTSIIGVATIDHEVLVYTLMAICYGSIIFAIYGILYILTRDYIIPFCKKKIMQPFLVKRFYRDIIYRKLNKGINSFPIDNIS